MLQKIRGGLQEMKNHFHICKAIVVLNKNPYPMKSEIYIEKEMKDILEHPCAHNVMRTNPNFINLK